MLSEGWYRAVFDTNEVRDIRIVALDKRDHYDSIIIASESEDRSEKIALRTIRLLTDENGVSYDFWGGKLDQIYVVDSDRIDRLQDPFHHLLVPGTPPLSFHSALPQTTIVVDSEEEDLNEHMSGESDERSNGDSVGSASESGVSGSGKMRRSRPTHKG